MANYNGFLFEGHGTSEKTGAYDPGATNGAYKENDLVDEFIGIAKTHLDTTSLSIHYDESNYVDNDLEGNTYTSNCGSSIHINAGGGTGVEIYVPLNEKELTHEFWLAEELSKLLNIPNRGIKSREYSSGESYRRSNGVALSGTDYYKEIGDAWRQGVSLAIIEIAFIDTTDLDKMLSKKNEIGLLLAQYTARNCGTNIVAYNLTIPTVEGSGFVGEPCNIIVNSNLHTFKYWHELNGEWTLVSGWTQQKYHGFTPTKAGRYKVVVHGRKTDNNSDKEDMYDYKYIDIKEKPAIYNMEVNGQYYGQTYYEDIATAVKKEMSNGVANIVLKKI